MAAMQQNTLKWQLLQFAGDMIYQFNAALGMR